MQLMSVKTTTKVKTLIIRQQYQKPMIHQTIKLVDYVELYETIS